MRLSSGASGCVRCSQYFSTWQSLINISGSFAVRISGSFTANKLTIPCKGSLPQDANVPKIAFGRYRPQLPGCGLFRARPTWSRIVPRFVFCLLLLSAGTTLSSPKRATDFWVFLKTGRVAGGTVTVSSDGHRDCPGWPRAITLSVPAHRPNLQNQNDPGFLRN